MCVAKPIYEQVKTNPKTICSTRNVAMRMPWLVSLRIQFPSNEDRIGEELGVTSPCLNITNSNSITQFRVSYTYFFSIGGTETTHVFGFWQVPTITDVLLPFSKVTIARCSTLKKTVLHYLLYTTRRYHVG